MYPSPSPQRIPEPAPVPREAAPFAPVTTLFMALNIAIFVVELVITRDVYDAIFFQKHSAETAMLATGGNYWLATIHEARYETLLTSCFVHGGALHLGFNMAALRQIGPLVERVAGASRMVPLYLISGIVASFVSTFYHVMLGDSDGMGVGASGAICGLIGAALVIGWRLQGPRSPIVRMTAGWLATILVLGLFIRGIDDAAHAGGAVAGAVIAFLWRRGFVYSTARRIAVLALCALVFLAAEARVVVADLQLPGATMRFKERLALANDAISRGDCATAREALESARRLVPDSPDVASTKALVSMVCR